MKIATKWILLTAVVSLAVLLSITLGFPVLHGQASSDPVRRVHLQATNNTAHLIVAAEGTDGVGGAGTDLFDNAEGAFCDIHYDSVKVEANSAELIGKAVQATNPRNAGAFVKITAHSDGRVNFVFQAITAGGAQTGPAGLDLTGTVTIVDVLP